MNGGRDPIERAATDEDLQEVATWEPRTRLDRLVHRVYESIGPAVRGILVAIAVLATLVILLVSTYDTPNLPVVAVFALASVVPALALAAYVYVSNVITPEPPSLLLATFALSFVFASFAAIANTAAEGAFLTYGAVGFVAYYLFVVAPGEEFVKLLAVRFYAYRDGRFDAVIDGAVYGAVAGLGFATIENLIYVSGFVETATAGTVVEQAVPITQQRALAGPGHVIYSAIAGYYLGLAKFNRQFSGALALKGIVIAAALHATYNLTVSLGSGLVAATFGLNQLVAFFVYIAAFDGAAGSYLFLKLRRYRRTYEAVGAGADDPTGPVGRASVDPGTNEPPIGADGDVEGRGNGGDARERTRRPEDSQRSTGGRDDPGWDDDWAADSDGWEWGED